MSDLTANDLKTRGVSAIEQALAGSSEVVVTVRGKQRYVVMDMVQYQHLRERELDAALAEALADVAAGRATRENAEAHVARLMAEE